MPNPFGKDGWIRTKLSSANAWIKSKLPPPWNWIVGAGGPGGAIIAGGGYAIWYYYGGGPGTTPSEPTESSTEMSSTLSTILSEAIDGIMGKDDGSNSSPSPIEEDSTEETMASSMIAGITKVAEKAIESIMGSGDAVESGAPSTGGPTMGSSPEDPVSVTETASVVADAVTRLVKSAITGATETSGGEASSTASSTGAAGTEMGPM